jgi:hypothetical protein
MTDIVTRLRNWRSVHLARLHLLMEEAADEMERLSQAPCPHVVGKTTQYCSLTPFTLTDKERKAIGWAIAECESMPVDLSREAAETLRCLLSRIGDFPEPENAANDDIVVTKTGGDFGQPSAVNSPPVPRKDCGECLTDEERDVLARVADDASYRAMERTERVVRGLLERMG